MSSFPTTTAADVIDAPIRQQLEAFLEEHRCGLNETLDGLTEEEARRSLVPSRTTPLGLLKHATFVERVWFDEGITCRSREEIGIPDDAEQSFILSPEDSVASVQQEHSDACEVSRRAAAGIGLDDLLLGNRRSPLPLRWVYIHMIRELAMHCGHADILREQILAGRLTG
ncbi:MAG: DinB family protein [Acidimicrobiales bacterium]